MNPENMREHLARYATRAGCLPPGAERTTALLGMMCVLAASADRLVDMPEEWGWPRIPPITE
ncbi:MAG: hypothetical protein ACREFQ_09330 [Stellaceae bacterium]